MTLPENFAVELRVGLLRSRTSLRTFSKQIGEKYSTVCDIIYGRRVKGAKTFTILAQSLPYLPREMRETVKRVLATREKVTAESSARLAALWRKTK